jgi:hypothetical protein
VIYYRKLENFTYRVAKYDDSLITSDDFQFLNDKEELSNFVLDHIMFVYLKKDRTNEAILAYLGEQIFQTNKKINPEDYEYCMSLKSKFIFMPFIRNHHWYLVILDTINCKFIFVHSGKGEGKCN